MTQPLDRHQALLDAMKSRAMGRAALAEWVEARAPAGTDNPIAWAKGVVADWFGDDPDKFAPKDWLAELVDVQGLCALRGYSETDVAAICTVPVEYARAWLAGTLPPQQKDAIALLRAPSKRGMH